jgi:hypothetical protein
VVLAEVLLVDFSLAVLLACFFAPAFLVLAVEVVVSTFELEAGAVCAKRDTPASAMAIVIPMIAFFIFVFLFEALVSARFCL